MATQAHDSPEGPERRCDSLCCALWGAVRGGPTTHGGRSVVPWSGCATAPQAVGARLGALALALTALSAVGPTPAIRR